MQITLQVKLSLHSEEFKSSWITLEVWIILFTSDMYEFNIELKVYVGKCKRDRVILEGGYISSENKRPAHKELLFFVEQSDL